MKNIKVIFCTDGIFPYKIGGMQNHSKLLIEALSKNFDLTIEVIHPHVGKKLFCNQIIEHTIQDIDIKKNYIAECYKYSKRVFEIIESKIDFIIYSQGLSVWYGLNKLKGKVIINPHGLEPFQTIGLENRIKAIPFKIIFKYLFRKSNAVVSLGGGLTEIISKKSNNKQIFVIPNGTNIEPNYSKTIFNNKKIKILFVARFSSNKGIDVLFNAIELLHKENELEKFEFNLIGKGELYEKYRALNKYKNVILHGYLDDEIRNEYFKKSDLFILPTLFEGMPTVVLEAMSYHLPIIVTKVGATCELVDSTNGYLIKANDSEAIKKSLVDFYFLSDIQKKSMGLNSFNRVLNQFTWKRVSLMHYNMFKDIK